MRGWISVLAVLATFQAIVQVASTDSAMGPQTQQQQQQRRSKHNRHRRSWSSPTLSFAAIVAAPVGQNFDLLDLNNIVLNSDNVKYPSHEQQSQEQQQQQQLLIVPTNSSAAAVSSSSSSPSANAVVNTKSSSSAVDNNINSSNHHHNNNSNSGNSNLIASVERTGASMRRPRKHADKGHRRRRGQQKKNKLRKNLRMLANNSVYSKEEEDQKQQQQQGDDVRLSSNELSGRAVVAEKEEEVVEEEDVEAEQEPEEEPRERIKPDAEMLVTIEKNLLSLFGFKKRPKIDRSKVVIPEAMRRLYAETTGMELDLTDDMPKPQFRAHHSANTVRSYTHEASDIDHRFVHHHRFRLHFNTSNIPADEILRAGELVLSRDAVPDADRIQHRVQVFDIIRPGVKGRRDGSFYLIDTKIVHVNSTENLILDVTKALERWQREPKHNHGLLVHVSTVGRRGLKRAALKAQAEKAAGNATVHAGSPEHHHVRLRRSVHDSEDAWTQKQPLFYAYTDDKRHRTSRAAKEGERGGKGRMRNKNKKKPRGICQRHALYVDFEDVGWNDWIVAPQGYDAFYCKGECRIPMADHLNATNHAVVQTLVNSINGQLAPRACCVPTELTTTSLLYMDDHNKLVLKKYQDMAVVGCGCR